MSHAPAPHHDAREALDDGADFFDRPVNSILQAAREAIVMIDERQSIVAVNAAAEQMFRCPAAELLGLPLAALVPDAHAERHAAQVHDYLRSHEMQQHLAAHRRILARRPDGSSFPAEITLSMIEARHGEGRPHVAALILDRSEQGRLQRELDAFRRRVRSVFELAPVAIWIADNEHVVFANQAALRLFGATSGLVGRPVYELLGASTRDALRAQVARALVGEPDVQVVRGHVARADGSQREVEIALAALPDHGRTTVQMVVADVTEQRREAAALAESREALRRLSASVVEAREEERRRIARELHDELGQRLTALKMELAALRGAAPAARDAQIENMLGMVDETLASVRRISTDLRPMMLDDLGLHAALEWLARDAARRLGIEVTLQLDEHEPALDDRVATAAFRMVQEALTNVARHARASDVQIGLHQAGGALQISVRDNGVGYPDDALRREGSMGLIGMRERAALLGGHAELSNPPGGGALLRVQLPLAPEDKENRA